MSVRLTTLRSVSRALARPLDIDAILRSLYGEMERVLDVTICFFGLYDALSQRVEVIWQVHEGVELPGGHFPLGSGPTSQAIRTCQPRLIRRWSKEGPRVQMQYATQRSGLPESGITVPVIFDDRVVGVLAVQSYQPEAFDEDDVALVQGIAEQAAVAIAAAQHAALGSPDGLAESVYDGEAILANMSDALLVLDDQWRVVRLNQAARKLLCAGGRTVIVGSPVDRPHDGHWPLGTRELTDQLRPILDQFKQGTAPAEEVRISVRTDTLRRVGCKASLLFKDGGAPAGGLVVLREISEAGRA